MGAPSEISFTPDESSRYPNIGDVFAMIDNLITIRTRGAKFLKCRPPVYFKNRAALFNRLKGRQHKSSDYDDIRSPMLASDYE